MRLYDFDVSLRELVFKAIARIEIALRTKMIHHFSLAHGAFWFADKSLSREERLFQGNIGSVERELLYIQLCCIAYLLNNILPGNTFTQTLKDLIAAYPNVDVAAMGFPSDWKTEALWQ